MEVTPRRRSTAGTKRPRQKDEDEESNIGAPLPNLFTFFLDTNRPGPTFCARDAASGHRIPTLAPAVPATRSLASLTHLYAFFAGPCFTEATPGATPGTTPGSRTSSAKSKKSTVIELPARLRPQSHALTPWHQTKSPGTGCRFDNSLGLLTKKFLALLQVPAARLVPVCPWRGLINSVSAAEFTGRDAGFEQSGPKSGSTEGSVRPFVRFS